MTRGQLGGSQFVGLLADFQVFDSVLSEDTIFQWTSCQTQVLYMKDLGGNYLV